MMNVFTTKVAQEVSEKMTKAIVKTAIKNKHLPFNFKTYLSQDHFEGYYLRFGMKCYAIYYGSSWGYVWEAIKDALKDTWLGIKLKLNLIK